MKRILFAFLLSIPLWAQCAAGDILWVKETVAADTVGAFNTFGSPFGIQQAFREVCPEAEIRIVKGTANYDSTTASWTNRDDQPTDPTIYVDTVDATVGTYIRVVGYLDATTPCALSAGAPLAGCPVTLDFSKSLVSAINTAGIRISNAGGDYYAWSWIRVTNNVGPGWEIQMGKGEGNIFYRCQADLNGKQSDASSGAGWYVNGGGSYLRWIASQANDNWGAGFHIAATNGAVLFSKSFNNQISIFDPTGSGIVFSGGVSGVAIGNTVWNNEAWGIVANQGGLIIGNTSRLNVVGGSVAGTGLSSGVTNLAPIAMFNVLGGNQVGLSTGGGPNWLGAAIGNNYGGNSTGPQDPDPANAHVATIDEDGLGAGTEPVTVVTFTGATNPTPTGGTADVNFYFPGTLLSTFQKGAVQVRPAATGGGGNSAYAH